MTPAPHAHDWATTSSGYGRAPTWQRCVVASVRCDHPWWERLADWLRGIRHEERFHELVACDAERMVKGGPW